MVADYQPVLSNEAYKAPRIGLPPRVLHGKMQRPHSAQPRGTKRTDKSPGPGYYNGPGLEKGYRQVYDRPAHWSLKGVGKDVPAIGQLGKAKVPGPGQYPVAKSFEATIPRVLYGKMLPVRKRPQSAPPRSGGPGGYNVQPVDPHMAAPDFKIRKTASRQTKIDKMPGPGFYKVKYPDPNMGAPDFRIRKSPSLDPRPNNVPGPGHYPLQDMSKYTRGAKWSQLHGVGRSSLHGTF